MSGWRKRQVSNQILMDEIYEVIRSSQHGMEGFLYTPPADQIILELKKHFGDHNMGKTITKGNIEIPYEAADDITVASLIEHREMLRDDLELQAENIEWLHEDDIVNHKKLIKAMNRIIKYYGGE